MEEKAYKRRKYPKKVKKVEAAIEIPEMEKEEEKMEVEEKVEVGIVEVRKKVKERKVIGMRYFIIYIGKATHLSLSGVGRITIGKRYEVRKEYADFLDADKNYKVIREPVFEE